ncbi:MAG: hypothetical protein JSR34_11890 [Proteobacteria bacterium]|nr:hypothetical protein [Pseudomonadota bacterium]
MRSTDAEHGEAAAFVAKWRAREPEMAFAEVFCPRPLRMRFALWGALLGEWREAALELSDPRPTQIKCLWWAEEVLLAAQAGPRHPLLRALALPSLPWQGLAQALAMRADAETDRPVDRAAALAAVAPLADAIAALEAALFALPASTVTAFAAPASTSAAPEATMRADPPSTVSASVAARQALAVHLLGERLRIGREGSAGGLLPLSLLARHGLTAAALDEARGEPVRRDWADELAGALSGLEPPQSLDACLYRRCRAGFDAWLLRDYAAGRQRRMPPLRALRIAWRCARQQRPR